MISVPAMALLLECYKGRYHTLKQGSKGSCFQTLLLAASLVLGLWMLRGIALSGTVQIFPNDPKRVVRRPSGRGNGPVCWPPNSCQRGRIEVWGAGELMIPALVRILLGDKNSGSIRPPQLIRGRF